MANEDNVFAGYLNDIMLTPKMDDVTYNEIGQKWLEKFLTSDSNKSDKLNRNRWANLMLTLLKRLKVNDPVPPPFDVMPPPGPLGHADSSMARGCPDRSSVAPVNEPTRTPVRQTAETFFSENLHVSFPNDLGSKDDGRDDGPLCDMIERLGCNVDVFEFIAAVAPYLDDKGDVLRKALDSELEHFVKNFIQRSHEMANADIGKLMAQKQCEQREKCTNWIQRVRHHTKINMEWLEKVWPGFNWKKYRADPVDYMKSILIPAVFEDEEQTVKEDFIVDWRRQNMLKLLLLRKQDETKECEIKTLRCQLDMLQRKLQDIEQFMLMSEEMRHEKRAQLLKQLEEVVANRDSHKEMIAAMFVALEAGSTKLAATM